MSDNAKCVEYLKTEIKTLQDENNALYEKLKRMECKWDQLIKQASKMETTHKQLEWEISRVRGDLRAKETLLQHKDEEHMRVKQNLETNIQQNQEMKIELSIKLEELQELHKESKASAEKHSHSLKVWREEKKLLQKQREDVTRKLEACEDELQAYFNENAKLEKHLKQVTKDYNNITHVHAQIQEILDSKETSWQKFVRRLGPRHESIQEVYKSALATSFCSVESGGLSPAGVLITNYVEYWKILRVQNVKQMEAVICALRDFLLEHFLDQDYVLFLISCTSLILYALHAGYDKDLDDHILISLDDYNFLESIFLNSKLEEYCGSGYSSDSSDYNTEGTAGYSSDPHADSGTDSERTVSRNRIRSGSENRIVPPHSKKSHITRSKSITLNLNRAVGMLTQIKPLLLKRPARGKPPLMSDTDGNSYSTDGSSSSSTSRVTSPIITATPRGRSDSSGDSTRDSDSGYMTPRDSSVKGSTSPPRRKGGETWEVVINNSFEFFTELNYIFSLNVTALLKRIFKRLDEIFEQAHIEEHFAQFCAYRASDTNGQPPTRTVLPDLSDLLNSLVSSFEVHMVYFTLAQKIFEEVFGRVGKLVANLVLSRSMRSEMFGNFLMALWERLEALCRGNEWTGNQERQLSLVKQCALLLCLKDKSLVDNTRKREATFPDLNDRNQIRHILAEPHHTRPHHSRSHTAMHQNKPHESPTVRLLLFHDLDFVRPISLRSIHYLGLEELKRLPVPPFLVQELGVS